MMQGFYNRGDREMKQLPKKEEEKKEEDHTPIPVSPEMLAATTDILMGTEKSRVNVTLGRTTILMTPTGVNAFYGISCGWVIQGAAIPNGRVDISPKIPGTMYDQIVALFKAVNARHKAEVLVYLWTNEVGDMMFTIPKQWIGGAHADPVDERMTPPEGEGWRLYAHIHSHNTMSAFFSGTDDRSEQQDGILYGVVGEITKSVPAAKFRVRMLGKWWDVKPEDAVAMTQPPLPEVPEEWFRDLTVGRAPTQNQGVVHHGGYGWNRERAIQPEIDWYGDGFVLTAAEREQMRRVMEDEEEEDDRELVLTKGNRRYQPRPRYLIRVFGDVVELDYARRQFVATNKRVEEISKKKLKHAAVEGVDWFGWPQGGGA